MNKKDTVQLLTILKVSYPYFYKDYTEKDILDAVDVWSMMFQEDDIRIVIEATKALLAVHKDYPPTIAHIKEKIELLTKKPSMTELEAWSIVLQAVKDSNYNAQKHFDNFPDIIKQVVYTPSQLREWALMDSDTVNSVVSSNFMRSYKAKAQHARDVDRLPQSGKNLLEMVQDKLLLEDKNG